MYPVLFGTEEEFKFYDFEQYVTMQFSPHFAQLEVLISDNRHYRVVFVSATTTSEQLHDLSAYCKPTDCYKGVYAVAKIALLFTSKLRASRFEGVSRSAGPSFRIKQDHL